MKSKLRSIGLVLAQAMATGALSANDNKMSLSIIDRPEIPPLLPTPLQPTPPDLFGRYYIGSAKWRHNQIKRKQLAKRK